MSGVDTSFQEQWFNEHHKGKRFRKPKGDVAWIAEALVIDRSYAEHYNFVHIYVRLRHPDTKRTELVTEYEFRHMKEIDDGRR